MFEHRIERKKDKLRVVLELPLGELLAHLGPKSDIYRARLTEYSARMVTDVLEVGQLISEEPENGIVKWFDDAKGYGFIRGHDSTDIFVHWHGIAGDGFKSLKSGQIVRFKRRMGKETFEAVDVELLPDKPKGPELIDIKEGQIPPMPVRPALEYFKEGTIPPKPRIP